MAEKKPRKTEETPEAEAEAEAEATEAAEPEAPGSSDVVEETTPEAPAAEPEASEPEPAETEPVEASPSADVVEETTPAAPAAATTEAPEADEQKRPSKRLPRRLRPERKKPVRERAAKRKPITRLAKPASEPGRRQERRGVVVSDKADKTIVVKVDVIRAHPKYKKVVRRSRKFHAHDEHNSAGIGDVVRIVETRPLSKTKNWRLAEIVQKAR